MGFGWFFLIFACFLMVFLGFCVVFDGFFGVGGLILRGGDFWWFFWDIFGMGIAREGGFKESVGSWVGFGW